MVARLVPDAISAFGGGMLRVCVSLRWLMLGKQTGRLTDGGGYSVGDHLECRARGEICRGRNGTTADSRRRSDDGGWVVPAGWQQRIVIRTPAYPAAATVAGDGGRNAVVNPRTTEQEEQKSWKSKKRPRQSLRNAS